MKSRHTALGFRQLQALMSLPLLAVARAVVLTSIILFTIQPNWVPTAEAEPDTAEEPIDGSRANCPDFLLDIVIIDVGIPDPGWVWVNPARKFRSVTGVVTKSEITHTDFPAAHDSHDQNTDILVDPGQEDILSDVGKDNSEDPRSPDTLELEWEIGTFPSETGINAPERTFPKWAWPNVDDRVWADGHWIFDCGHGTDVDGETHYRTEIHPARAIASMRDQVRTLPGTGTTPVPVTATDLYIHGRAGMVMDILECGAEVMIGEGSCTTAPYPHRGTPIDEDFEFDIHLPPKPSPSAVLAVFVEDGPGNTINIAPILEPMPAADPTSVHVTIPLAGSGVTPDDVYARQIYVGWVFPPDSLRHFRLTLNKMDLHDDHDTDPTDCECTFFWMNVDRAPAEWFRLVDFEIPTDDEAGFPCPSHVNTMNDYDDDGGCGNGELNFSGPTFDFYVRNGQSFTMRAHGYDQDCLDDHFGDHSFDIGPFLDCYLPPGNGDNDDFATLSASFGPPGYGVGSQDITASGEYELEFTIEEFTIIEESDLRLIKVCEPDETVLAGEPFTCTIFVDNPGPGLPRSVVVEDTLLTSVDPSDYTMGTPTFTFTDGFDGSPFPCSVAPPNQFTCNLGTVPVDGRAVITVQITSNEGGDFNNEAQVSTDSTDPDTTNNEASDSLTVTPVADLSITKSDSPDPVNEWGDTEEPSLTYTLGVNNAGPSTATSIEVTDTLPAGVTFADASGNGWTCNEDAGTVTCNRISLAVEPAPPITVTTTIPRPDEDMEICNSVEVGSAPFDPDLANSTTTECTRVIVPPKGTDSLTVRAFIDYRCDGFFQAGLDIPLPDVPVTLTFENSASEIHQTRPFGMVNFSGFDASGGVNVSAELPESHRGYLLGSCPNSPVSIELEPDDFQFGHKFVHFGAEVLGEAAGP